MSKELVVRPDGKGMYTIAMDGGGPTPKDLEGRYTSYEAGNAAIRIFQSKVQDRVENGKSKPRI